MIEFGDRIWTLVISGGLLVAFLGGCAEAKSTPTGAPAVLVEYHRNGGIAGLDDKLVINGEGLAVLTRKTGRYEFSLDQDTTKEIQNRLDEAEFGKLNNAYLPSRQGSDLIEYLIIYQNHTVRTKDTAVPSELLPVIDVLNEVIENQGKRNQGAK